jgi:hypothetical protein
MLTLYQVNEDRDKVCGAALAQATRLIVNIAFLMGCPHWQTDMMEAQLNNECVLPNVLA